MPMLMLMLMLMLPTPLTLLTPLTPLTPLTLKPLMLTPICRSRLAGEPMVSVSLMLADIPGSPASRLLQLSAQVQQIEMQQVQ